MPVFCFASFESDCCPVAAGLPAARRAAAGWFAACPGLCSAVGPALTLAAAAGTVCPAAIAAAVMAIAEAAANFFCRTQLVTFINFLPARDKRTYRTYMTMAKISDMTRDDQ
jgi:hypothetical protein